MHVRPLALPFLVLALVGCADRGLDPGGRPFDFSVSALDAASSPSDFATPPGCTPIAVWHSDQVLSGPQDQLVPEYDWGVFVEGLDLSQDPLDQYLFFEYLHEKGAPPPVVPHTSNATPMSNEDLELVFFDGAMGATRFFLPTSGTVEVDRLDEVGNLTVRGQDIVFEETDDTGVPLPGGGCFALGTFLLESP